MPECLSDARLGLLPASVRRPAYDRRTLRTGIVHLGLGAFHRAHQAAYTDDVLASGDPRWGIAAASLRSPETRDALGPQDGLYTLDVRGPGCGPRVIGSVVRMLVAQEDPDALLRAMASPDTRIVSLTVTEKAYCREPATDGLDAAHPDIGHDLRQPDRPRSPLGFLLAAIERRRAAGTPPFTVLCCDNLPANGQTVRRLLASLAALRSPDLADFVEAEVSCPDTMVDRIVPATSDEDRARVAAALGVRDAWPVVAEPFTQWVIADRFPAGRPAWENAGVLMVTDVAPWEAMKLRMLNGAHSALACLGALSGLATVAEAMADPVLAGFAARIMDDAAATLPRVAGLDPAAYKAALLARFGNPLLRHRLAQIATDGSQKLPQRILAPAADRLTQGQGIDAHAMVVAGWILLMTGPGGSGPVMPVPDPMADALARAASGSSGEIVPAVLGLHAVFGELGRDPRFRAAVEDAYGRLAEVGATRAAAAVAAGY